MVRSLRSGPTVALRNCGGQARNANPRRSRTRGPGRRWKDRRHGGLDEAASVQERLRDPTHPLGLRSPSGMFGPPTPTHTHNNAWRAPGTMRVRAATGFVARGCGVWGGHGYSCRQGAGERVGLGRQGVQFYMRGRRRARFRRVASPTKENSPRSQTHVFAEARSPHPPWLQGRRGDVDNGGGGQSARNARRPPAIPTIGACATWAIIWSHTRH